MIVCSRLLHHGHILVVDHERRRLLHGADGTAQSGGTFIGNKCIKIIKTSKTIKNHLIIKTSKIIIKSFDHQKSLKKH
jgi:hypothetical protein